MIIKLKDGTETIVNNEKAERAIEQIESGAVSFRVNGMWIRSDWVAVIKPGGTTEVDIVPRDHQLDRPDHRGEYSPAKEKLRKLWGND
jgi:hypothetical protein